MSFFCVKEVALSVEIGFSGGARAPAFVDPEPLFRVGADHALDGGGEVCRVGLDVSAVVPGADEFDGRFAVKEETPAFFVPHGAGRDDD